MFYDHAAERRRKESEEKYAKHKETLMETKKGKINADNFLVLEHLHKMEDEIEKLKKRNEEYRTFFKLLGNLLPRQSSIRDIIR